MKIRSFFGGGREIAAARELVRQGATLLDVRTEAEFDSGHLEGAVNIPVDSLGFRHVEIDRTRPVVVYCKSGVRSASAKDYLLKRGFPRVVDVGPMPDW